MIHKEIDEVKALAEIMTENDLTSVKIKFEDGGEIAIERALGEPTEYSITGENVMVNSSHSTMGASAVTEKPAAPVAPKAPTAVEEPQIKGGTAVKSPMVGVFYSAPSPEENPYVKIGDKVKKGDVLCIIEAMKLMNEITAEQDGEIAEICVEDGGLVEFGQTLFIVK